MSKGPLPASSSPVLRAVPDIQDFNDLVGVTVDDNIRRHDKFASAFDFSVVGYFEFWRACLTAARRATLKVYAKAVRQRT